MSQDLCFLHMLNFELQYSQKKKTHKRVGGPAPPLLKDAEGGSSGAYITGKVVVPHTACACIRFLVLAL